MARGVNKVILVGHLGKDPRSPLLPERRGRRQHHPRTSESWKDKTTGEKKESTEWHRVVFFGRLAEIAGEYLKKGAQIYVEGRLQTRKWQDKEGKDRYTTEIVAGEMQMLGSREGRGAPSSEYDQSADEGRSSGGGRAPATASSGGAKPGAASDFDDDIPF